MPAVDISREAVEDLCISLLFHSSGCESMILESDCCDADATLRKLLNRIEELEREVAQLLWWVGF